MDEFFKLLHLNHWFEIMPILMVGFLIGIISYYIAEDEAKSKQEHKDNARAKINPNSLKRAFFKGLSSMLMAGVAFGISGEFLDSYQTRVAIAALIAKLGLENALELISKFIGLKGLRK